MTALHVEDTGAGAPVVLIHSSGLSGRQWRRLASELAATHLRAIVPDLTGHGRSPAWPEPTPFAFTTDVARVAALVRSLAPVHLIGHSYGGLIALHVARAAPAHVRSLAVFDPVAFGALDPARDDDALAILRALDLTWGPTADDRERWLRTFVDFWGGDGAWAALREEMRAEFRRVAWVVREGVRTLMDDAAPAATYAGLAMPVQLITGERSPLPAGRVIARLAEALPHARVTVVPGVGHLAPLSDPGAVNPVFLDALPASGS